MRKRVNRRVYNTAINPIAHAIAGACITDKESLDKLRLTELAAIDAMARGQGTVQDWGVLSDLLNVTETMADSGIGPEALPYCQQLQEDLINAARRYESTKKMGMTGVGLKAAREVFDYHDMQRLSIPRSLYEKMIEKTRNRIQSNHHRVLALT